MSPWQLQLISRPGSLFPSGCQTKINRGWGFGAPRPPVRYSLLQQPVRLGALALQRLQPPQQHGDGLAGLPGTRDNGGTGMVALLPLTGSGQSGCRPGVSPRCQSLESPLSPSIPVLGERGDPPQPRVDGPAP